MNMTSVTVRVDEDTKKQASDIAEDFGFDLSSVTRAFTGRSCVSAASH